MFRIVLSLPSFTHVFLSSGRQKQVRPKRRWLFATYSQSHNTRHQYCCDNLYITASTREGELLDMMTFSTAICVLYWEVPGMYLARNAGSSEFPLFFLVTGKCLYTEPPQDTIDNVCTVYI